MRCDVHGDECPLADVRGEQPGGNEIVVRLRDCRAAQPQPGGQLARGGQLLPAAKPSGLDETAQTFGKLPIHRLAPAAVGPERNIDHAPRELDEDNQPVKGQLAGPCAGQCRRMKKR